MTQEQTKKGRKLTRRGALKGLAASAGVAAARWLIPGPRVWAAEPIKVGVISPLTGAWTVYGKAHSEGFLTRGRRNQPIGWRGGTTDRGNFS
jgi:hypothetical protein